jgi:hypothetical protein
VVAAVAGLAVAVQLWGLYLPDPPADTDWFPGADKVQHGVAFGLPVALVMLADTLRRRSRGHPPRARVLVIELIQAAFYTDRHGDPLDVLADWSGIAIAAMLTGLGIGLRRVGVRRTEAPEVGVARHG